METTSQADGYRRLRYRHFSVRVALHGDTVLISARRDDLEGVGVDAGSAYDFERKNGVWKQTQKLIALDANEDDRFAWGVALYSDKAIINNMHHDAKADNAGAVYVFKKLNGQWQSSYTFYGVHTISVIQRGYFYNLQ